MGIFFKRVKVFNRAPVPVFVTFDGQVDPIPPGEYDLPEQTIGKAMNQNPIMGTGDPYNPGAAGTKYLIVTEDDPLFGTPLTEEEWTAHLGRPCRVDETVVFAEKYGNDPKAKMILHGKQRTVAAKSRTDAGGLGPRGNAEFTQREAV